jgi:hypothetical protein
MSAATNEERRAYEQQELESRILGFLATRGFAALKYVRVDVSDSEVRLSGVVGAFYAKQMAQEYVRRLAGARLVINEVAVATVIDTEGPFDPTTDILQRFPVKRAVA